VKLDGRVGLVFGGSSGIGRACAVALAEEGAAIVVASPHEEDGREVVDAIARTGGSASYLATDITDEGSVERAVHGAVGEFGRLDTVITSAGAHLHGEDAWHAGIDLFLKGPYYASRHALPELERNGGGALIHIASIAAIRGTRAGHVDRSAYAVAKHGVLGLTRTLALAYGDRNIRVNAICPGYIRTPLTRALHESADRDRFVREELRVPLGRWGEPEEIGKVAAFLASDDASYISGQAIVVDGGMTAR
jgi:NAD(P)-dependent dehydrogenase (short-subunit alcohol dehydrogenase family)